MAKPNTMDDLEMIYKVLFPFAEEVDLTTASPELMGQLQAIRAKLKEVDKKGASDDQ